MNEMHHRAVGGRLFTAGTGVALALMAAAVLVAIYRFALGLGATTNLSDQYPWGLWVALDVVCGVALAAGGFTTAAVVYIFGGEKYHGLVRPAVLTALIGYVFVGVGLLADLGLPWNIWHPLVMWPKHSAMFELAWCVMLYLTVLVLEFAPSIFERFGWTKLRDWWRAGVPVFVVFILTLFTYAMSRSVVWTAAAFSVLSILAVVFYVAYRKREGVPLILILAGILLSTAHQSSLGTVFLLMPDRLNHLWWTPILPLNFLLSAVAVGLAMVIFESTLAARVFERPVEGEALRGISRILVACLWFYFLVRIGDLVFRGNLYGLGSLDGALFVLELGGGVVLPAILLAVRKWRTDIWLRFSAACMVVGGLILNRFNVTLFAMHRAGTGSYFPSPEEILISAGIMAAIVFIYNFSAKTLPVLPEEEEHHPSQPLAARAGGK